MRYLYLDESGDLGFDFINKKPSRFFTITILSIQGTVNNRRLISTVKKVIRRKLSKKQSTADRKEYFYKLLKPLSFELFSISLNKRKAFEKRIKEKHQLYNYMARLVLEKIDLENADASIELVVDKSKGKVEIQKFNQYIFQELAGKTRPKVRFTIRHMDSLENKALQAADVKNLNGWKCSRKKLSTMRNIYKKSVLYGLGVSGLWPTR